MPRAFRRQRGVDKDGDIIAAIAHVLNFGESSKFQFEGYCTHTIRQFYCLSGSPWQQAADRAHAIVREALNKIGATRPSWQAGQPSYVELYDGWSLVDYRYCQRENCGNLIEHRVNRSGVQKKYCSELCGQIEYQRRISLGIEQASKADYLAACATRKEQTRTERAKRCANPNCSEMFFPGENNRFKDRLYCSTECANTMPRRPRPPPPPRPPRIVPMVPCETCGTMFPARTDRQSRFCKLGCYWESLKRVA